jgi:trypsin
MRISTQCFLFSILSLLTCSIAASSNEMTNGTVPSSYARIVGGSQPSRNRYPYFVRIDHNNRLHCGGVLIAPDIVLTAAHCVMGSGTYTAYVNAFNTYRFYSGVEVKAVSSASKHPSYSSRTRGYDLAIMKLSSPVNNPVTIPINGLSSEPGTGDSLTVIGVGADASGRSTVWLHEAEVNMVSPRTCNINYGGKINDRTMFCARDPGQDSCQGDSGGPIMQTIGGVEQVVGIVSWGIGCAEAAYPGVYARTSAAKQWIDIMVSRLSTVAVGRRPIPVTPPPPPPPVPTPSSNSGSTPNACADRPDATFVVGPLGTVDCAWLENNPRFVSIFCRSKSIKDACEETCGKCSAEARTAVSLTAKETPDADEAVPFRPNCDDDPEATFRVNDELGDMQCVWLAARPEWQAQLCNPSHPAYSRCEETCQACQDTCEDSKQKFEISDVQRSCLWLSLRPTAQKQVCNKDHDAWTTCPETCENCSDNTTPPQPRAPNLCEDSQRDRFWVNDDLKDQSCVWLQTRPQWRTVLCQAGSVAEDSCPKTCGACPDDCVDSSAKFAVDGGVHDCLWLSLRPVVQDKVCAENDLVRNACAETCNTCDRRL